jgi:cytochrome c oxidase assembly factor CtaG
LQTGTVLGLVALAALTYTWRARGLSRGGLPIGGRRKLSFYAGLGMIGAALLALGHLAHVSMYGREAQHFVVGEIASLLIVLGFTAPLLAPLSRGRLLGGLTLIANPVCAFALWAVDLYVWHLPGPYQAAIEHTGIQALQQVCLLLFGINMWLCLFGALPMPAWFGDFSKLGYLLAVRVTGAVLANIFLWSKVVSYPYFIHLDTARQLSPVVDENLAGAAMLVAGSALTLCMFGWLYARTRDHDVIGGSGLALSGSRGGRPQRVGAPATAAAIARGGRLSAATADQPPATAGRIVSSAPSLTGVSVPSKKRMSSPLT